MTRTPEAPLREILQPRSAPRGSAPRGSAPRGEASSAGLPIAALCALVLVAVACSPGEDPEQAAPGQEAAQGAPDTAEVPVGAGELLRLAAAARGFPTLRDAEGRLLARGDFVQWVEGEALHMRIVYEFEDGRRIEEVAVFGLRPGLVQTGWSWDETRRGETVRRFDVDFERGTARGEKREEGEIERWSEELDIEPGRSFAGFGFTVALKGFHDRLLEGETIELQAVGITPEPRVVDVEISHAGRARMRMGSRTLTGDHFVIEPQIPFLAEPFVEAPDTHIWLTAPPAEFLRSEGPLLEPGDPTVRIDLLPGEESGPAEPL